MIKLKIIRFLKSTRGLSRLALGFCPLCNSDAPEVYDCPVCSGYQSASGDKWPPPRATKKRWWRIYKNAIGANYDVKKLIAKHKS